jgi:serine/threonine protein kinase
MLTHDLVAIKLEHCSSDLPFLGYEIGAYEEVDGQPGFARVFWQGYQDEFKAMVFELLGPNLEDLFRYCDGRFSLKTTLMLMDQLLHRAETLHKARYLHRDIKPENFLLGTGKQGNIVYMTDLGLATGWYDAPDPADASCYRMARHNNNPAASPRVCLVGTCRYASINGHVMGGKFKFGGGALSLSLSCLRFGG